MPSSPRDALPRALPGHLASQVWRGTDFANARSDVVASGFAALDRELPGGGWPCGALSEVLQAQPGVLEWRLLGPALRGVVAEGRQLVVVGPPRQPHLPGLRHAGIDARQLVWVQADTPAERLWCTEQLVRSDACGALLAWLPQARPEQVRRLQVCAQACRGPVFLLRPAAARQQPSAAPLRVLAALAADWSLRIELLKRRGPVLPGLLRLDSVPGGLDSVLTPRLRASARVQPTDCAEAGHALGSPAAAALPRRHAASH